MCVWTAIDVVLSLIQDEEIEMEDAEDWSIVDIDSPDKKNSLAVVEYIDDIYAYYKKSEVEMLSPIFLFVCWRTCSCSLVVVWLVVEFAEVSLFFTFMISKLNRLPHYTRI